MANKYQTDGKRAALSQALHDLQVHTCVNDQFTCSHVRAVYGAYHEYIAAATDVLPEVKPIEEELNPETVPQQETMDETPSQAMNAPRIDVEVKVDTEVTETVSADALRERMVDLFTNERI